MGQCYALGATINPACDHAMRVDEAGGACVCPTCEVRCEGRFEACGPILQRPGYVPVSAPQWAIDCVDPAAPEETIRRSARNGHAHTPSTNGAGPAGDLGVLAVVRSEFETVTDKLLAAIDAVRRDLVEYAGTQPTQSAHGSVQRNGSGVVPRNGCVTRQTTPAEPEDPPRLQWTAPPRVVESTSHRHG